MKKAVKKLILSLCLVFFGQAAFCYTLTNTELTKIINQNISDEIKSYVLKYSDDYKISISGIPKESILTNETACPKIEILSQGSGFRPNLYKRIVVKDSKNNVIKAFPINVQTLIYKNVLVASAIIPYNTEINAKNTTFERKEISRYLGKTLSNNYTGFVSSRNYSKGSIILSDSIKQKALVSKDSCVDIIFLSSKGLKITLQGKALKEGAMGDTILVRSNKYNKIYNATVSSSNEVTVRI